MQLETTELLLRLAVSLVLGALIGLDRRKRSKPAGVRTMALVSLGSATFTLIAVTGMIEIATLHVATMGRMPGFEAAIRFDVSRVIAGIVGGIGFLGAGAIIQSRGRVQGMTTASGIWMTSAIGVATGLGQYVLALAATFLAFVVLVLLRRTFEEQPDTDQKNITPKD